MANNSVDQFTSLINKQIDFHSKIQDHLSKLMALSDVALCEDFLDCSPSTIHDYQWDIYDHISETKALHEQALSELVQSSYFYCSEESSKKE